jgi:hypothetical protein
MRMVILVYLTCCASAIDCASSRCGNRPAVFGLLLNDRVLDLWIRLMSGDLAAAAVLAVAAGGHGWCGPGCSCCSTACVCAGARRSANGR